MNDTRRLTTIDTAMHTQAQRRLTRRRRFWLAIGLCLALGLAVQRMYQVRLVWINLSPSAPRGLYIRQFAPEITGGSYVIFPVPPRVHTLVASWGWPDDALLLKPVAGLPGDTVCITNGVVTINTRHAAVHLDALTTRYGLPHTLGCFALGLEDIFVLSTHHPRSFDGRYFGPTHREDITAVVRPLLIEGGY